MDTTKESVRLAAAAAAIGTDTRALRAMAARIPLLTARTHRRWGRYSPLDCVRLAVVARLQEFGIGLCEIAANSDPLRGVFRVQF